MADQLPSSSNQDSGLKLLLEKLAKASSLDEQFATRANVSTTENLIPPRAVRDVDAESVKPKLTPSVTVDASRKTSDRHDKEDLDAKTGFTPGSASDMLSSYADMSIYYAARKTPSSYIPSAYFCFYIVHLMNSLLVDSHYFRRACPDYHPYVFRLYVGILFWIQCARASVFTNTATAHVHQFLTRFLETHNLLSLPVPSPLLMIFKTLCASQPEITEYGYVYPAIPATPGPARRDSFIRDEPFLFALPNVPGIFALLRHLNEITTAANPIFPSKGSHIPIGANAGTFGFHAFPAEAERSAKDKWSLITPGLDYPCEADKKMNEVFSERFSSFNFPPQTGNENISLLSSYLSLAGRTDWFARVKEVASVVSAFFEGSGTLADCASFGYSANQVLIEYADTAAVLPSPTQTMDVQAHFPFAFRAATSARKLAAMTVPLACSTQTNVRMPSNHPFFSVIGTPETLTGPFWNIAPVDKSERNDESYLSMASTIRGLLLDRKPSTK